MSNLAHLFNITVVKSSERIAQVVAVSQEEALARVQETLGEGEQVTTVEQKEGEVLT